jgi:DNA polymerase III subunit delta'
MIPIGQATAMTLLDAAVAKQRIAPAYLFVGPDGVGKAIAARYFAQLLLVGREPRFQKSDRQQLSNFPDLLWVEPTYLHNGKRLTASEAAEAGVQRKTPPQIRLDQIREIAQFLSRPPLEADRSVIVLEQAQTMAESAANGLLKTLEEPGRATLILLSPSVESLLPTLVSRCQRIPFSRLSQTDLAQVLRQTGYTDILSYPALLATAQGSPGAAIAAWQYLDRIPPELLARVTQFPRSLREALQIAKEIAATLEPADQLWLLDYLQQHYWQQYLQGSIAVCPLQTLENARQHLRSYVQPRLVWEVALMEMKG